ncbi:MAG: hypothetical protein EXS05_20870, partial [Planctomycetaceae bacterium]|nr:hypothetical protein [Planctomycetaceae bacterium]
MTRLSLIQRDLASLGQVLSLLVGCSVLGLVEIPATADESPAAVAQDDAKDSTAKADEPAASSTAVTKDNESAPAKVVAEADKAEAGTKSEAASGEAENKPAEPPKRSGRTSRGGEKDNKAKADEAVVDFKAARELKANGASEADEAGPGNIGPENAGQADPEVPRLSFKMRFAPWESVLKRFADEARLTLDMSEVPPGTFNYYDDGLYTPTQVIDTLNAYLSRRGFLLFRHDRFLVVVNLDNGIPPYLVPRVTLSDLPKRGQFEYMSVVMPIPNGDTQAILDDVKDFLGAHGKVVALRANQLLISDLGSNLQDINKWLSEVGVIENPKGTNFRSFKIIHVTAGEAERMVRDLFNLPIRGAASRTTTAAAPVPAVPTNSDRGEGRQGRGGGQWGGGQFGGGQFGGGQWGGGGGPWGGGGAGGGGGDAGGGGGDRGRGRDQQPQQPAAAAVAAAVTPKILMTIDTRTNSLLVTANHDEMVLIDLAIKTIDVPQGAAFRAPIARGYNVPQLEPFPVENADVQVVVDLLYATVPGLTVYPDTRTRRIYVYASPDDLAQVRGIIKSLDTAGGGETLSVIPLRKLEPLVVVTSLRGLFGGNRADAPSIEADTVGRKVMVRGTAEQVSQIRKALAGLGEDGNTNDVAGSGGPVRRIDVGSRSPEELVALVQRFMPKSEGSFIRVLPPSTSGMPSFRPRTSESPYERGSRDEIFPRDADADDSAPPRRGGALRSEPSRSGAAPYNGAAIPGRPSSSRSAVATPRGAAAPSIESPSVTEKSEALEIERLSRELEAALEGDDELDEVDDDSNDVDANVDDEEAGRPGESAAASKADDTEVGATAADPEGSLSTDDVTITTYGGKILMYSENEAALDRLEKLLQALVQAAPAKSKWNVYYLRSADATETAAVLGSLFPTGSVARTAEQSSSSFLGGLTGSLSSLGDNLANASGLGSLGQSEPLRIVPEPRSNALYISGSSDQVNEVLQALEVLDTAELPQSLKDRSARMIVVEHADVNEVAEIVRDVYKEQLEPPPQNQMAQGGRGGGGFNPLAMLMGGGGAPQGKQKGVLLSIGIDVRTSTLVVSASDQLFREVETLVKSLDRSAYEQRKTVRVMSVSSAGSQLVQEALRPLLGKVRVSSTGSVARLGEASRPQQQQTQQQFGTQFPFGGGMNPAVLMQLQQRGGGQFGGGGGNPFGGGLFGGGGQFGGGRGGNGG